MEKILATTWINTLEELTNQSLLKLNDITALPIVILQKKPVDGGWNILECAEHLNLYCDYYIPEIERNLNEAKQTPALYFKSGFWGNYFINTIKPKEKLNKMKTLKLMDPGHMAMSASVLLDLQKNLESLLHILERAKNYNLNKVKTNVSLSPLFRLKLGDTLAFVVWHNERHFCQIADLMNLSIHL